MKNRKIEVFSKVISPDKLDKVIERRRNEGFTHVSIAPVQQGQAFLVVMERNAVVPQAGSERMEKFETFKMQAERLTESERDKLITDLGMDPADFAHDELEFNSRPVLKDIFIKIRNRDQEEKAQNLLHVALAAHEGE